MNTRYNHENLTLVTKSYFKKKYKNEIIINNKLKVENAKQSIIQTIERYLCETTGAYYDRMSRYSRLV